MTRKKNGTYPRSKLADADAVSVSVSDVFVLGTAVGHLDDSGRVEVN